MVRPTDLRSTDDARAVARTGLWVLAVQCLLALSWTLYVLFLPGMLADAGIERRWFVYVLLADQAIFAALRHAAAEKLLAAGLLLVFVVRKFWRV